MRRAPAIRRGDAPPRPAQPAVAVWRVVPLLDPAAGLDLLAPDELARARVGSAGRRLAYVSGRIALRLGLAEASGIAPDALRFSRVCHHCGDASHGKPTVVGMDAAHLDFSISYDDTQALIAIGRSCRVGVDVAPVVAGSVAHPWCFSPSERAELARLTGPRRDRAVASSWARKEAVAKAMGQGLALPLSALEVTGARPSWVVDAGWHVDDVPAGDGFAAAVAFDESAAEIRCTTWDWPALGATGPQRSCAQPAAFSRTTAG